RRARRADRRGTGRAGELSAQPRDATITYPGGLRVACARAGSGRADAVFALSEVGGALRDLGPEVSSDPDSLCRAELRIDGPAGAWTGRFSSTIKDKPAGTPWGHAGQD